MLSIHSVEDLENQKAKSKDTISSEKSRHPLRDRTNNPSNIPVKSKNQLQPPSTITSTKSGNLVDKATDKTNNAINELAMWGEDSVGELRKALMETLEENKKVHEVCQNLKGELQRLKGVERELAVVTMLYDVAKSEIEEMKELLLNNQTSIQDIKQTKDLKMTSSNSSELGDSS